jgi:hypothetical protein
MLIVFRVWEVFVDVFVDVRSLSKCFEAFRIDVEEVWGKWDQFSGEIGKESKGGDRAMEYGSVEFADDVGSTEVLFDDDEGAKISRSHLAISRFLDLCVAK